jgi:hypothetical protein
MLRNNSVWADEHSNNRAKTGTPTYNAMLFTSPIPSVGAHRHLQCALRMYSGYEDRQRTPGTRQKIISDCCDWPVEPTLQTVQSILEFDHEVPSEAHNRGIYQLPRSESYRCRLEATTFDPRGHHSRSAGPC